MTRTPTPKIGTLFRSWTVRHVSQALGVAVLLGPAMGFATASLKANCYLQDRASGFIQGVNVDERYPIASVSKILTSYWAIKKMGAQGRFETLIHVRPITPGTVDLHIAGVRDPYVGKWALQFLVSELNGRGITQVRNFTFDEDFKFLNDTSSNKVAVMHFDNTEPGVKRVGQELRTAISHLMKGYESLRAKAKQRRGMDLPVTVGLKVEDIRFLARADFRPAVGEEVLVYRSAPLAEALKEMNRNSNNHAANQIFESLGGVLAFRNFMAEHGFDHRQVLFFNGSGDRKDFPDQSFAYNQATCRTVVRIVKKLCQELRVQGLDLEQVLAVAGRAPPGERSTVEMYKSDETDAALIAKTGTVNPAITLAGMLSTEEGEIYFGYIYKTADGSDWRNARSKIRVAVTEMIQRFGGRDPIDYAAESFLPFDPLSKLVVAGSAGLP